MFKKRTRPEKSLKKDNEDNKEKEETNIENDYLKLKKAKQEQSVNFHTTGEQNKQSKEYLEKETKELKFNAKTELIGKNIDQAATRTLDIDEEQDAFDKAKQNITLSKEVAEGKLKTNVYRGEAGYANYVKLTEDDLRAQRARGTLGPLKAPTNIRSTVRVDYQKYLCKDYNEKGYCGYGDSCIYLHDRYDYKSGWEIDAEYEKQQKLEQRKLQGFKVEEEPNYEIHSDDENNNICPICSNEFKKPVITQCGHTFCESCALKHYGKTGKCFICNKETNGIFNNLKIEKKSESHKEPSKEKNEFTEYKETKEKIKEKTYNPTAGWVIP